MRVLRAAVVTGRIGGLDPVEAGTALGRGLARRAVVAVVPVAAGGPDLAVAVAALWGTGAVLDRDRWLVRKDGRVLLGLAQPPQPAWAPAASTADLGTWLAQVLEPGDREVALDLTGVTAHDGGRGLLAAASGALGGRDLIGIVAGDEVDVPATGIGGGLARRGFAAGLDVAELLAADAELAGYAASLGDGLASRPGSGAAGGCGLAVLASGGRLESGTQFCHRAAGLADTLAVADLVLTGCTELSALDRGGPVVQAVAGWAEQAQRPCLLVTGGPGLARRELRTLGIEAVHLLPPGPPAAAGLAAVAERVAAGWVLS